ncbi:SseB family protein [Streptomyces montanus]|uniref:SseB family protein n=1 Tax=Streptomyces montanus TaxID=2580423 RepID=A0A5R9FR54_9ACTN|nr:SseB family protein [Streptomyces montanus]TLS43313.1 SseB family protein [Streptomyces montanus]
MEFPSNESATSEVERALSVLVENTEDDAALDALAGSEVLVPVPDDADDDTAADPTTVALPVLEQDGETPLVPVFTSELRMAELLPYVSRYRVVPLGALASQWPTGDLSLTIDASSPHGLTLNSEGVRTLLARPRG